MAGYLHLNRVRRPSERIRIKHSFSNFKNTKDTPVLVDMDEGDVNVCDRELEGIAKKKSPVDTETLMEIDIDNACNVRRSRKRKGNIPDSSNTNVSGVELLMEDLTMAEKEVDKGFAKGVTGNIDSNTKNHKYQKLKSSSCSMRTRSHTSGRMKLNTPMVKGKTVVETGECHNQTGSKRSRMSSRIKNKLRNATQQKRGKVRMAKLRRSSLSGIRRGLGVLRARTSPKALHDLIVSLNNDQQETVRKMGLESLLGMEMDGVPTKLDTNEMGIRVGNGLIPVTIDSIHNLTGFPRGEIDILHVPDVPSHENLVSVWKKQFKVPKIRPQHVVDKIKESTDSGFHFKINFLVVFVNIMIESNSMGTVNLNFLSKIKSNDMIDKVDWCKYLYERVKTSIINHSDGFRTIKRQIFFCLTRFTANRFRGWLLMEGLRGKQTAPNTFGATFRHAKA